jgi:thiol-disulfide isomerase/thioredoxin
MLAAAAICFVVVAASGCGEQKSTESPTASAQQPAAVAADATSPAQLRTVTSQEIRALVEERKGKVVVVNFWASWCPPCVREFPAIISVYEQYRDNGLDMLAVSMNSPEEMKEVDEFLKTHKPPFPVYLADSKDENFSESVLEEWYGEMPLTLVFDTAGQRVLAHRKELSYEELSSKVQALLPPK